MRFYTSSHAHYCGIDLHARTMYACVLDREGEVLLHQNLPSCPQAFLEAVSPYREDLVVAAECIFIWYWLADLSAREAIPFVLGHALYMKAYHRLRSVPGIGKILALTILYEIHDIGRFERVQDFLSYARLVKCEHSSAGRRLGTGGAKVGNVHLKWAFSEAAVLFLRKNPRGQEHLRRLAGRHGKSKALSILAAKLGRCVYHLLRKQRTFDAERFFAMS